MVGQGLNQRQSASSFTFGRRKSRSNRPFEPASMVRDLQSNLVYVAPYLHVYRLLKLLTLGVLDGIIASFNQRQFAGHNVILSAALLGQKTVDPSTNSSHGAELT